MRHKMVAAKAAGGGLTIVARDTFTRADSSSLGTTEVGGFAWSEDAGDVTLVSTGVRANTSNNSYGTFNSGVSNFTLTANVTTSTTADRTVMAVVARFQDVSNWVAVEVLDIGASNALQLSKIVGGGQTIIGTYAAGFGPSEPHLIKIVTSGSNYDVYLDGVLRISTSDAFISTATKQGIRWYADGGTDNMTSRLEDIKVEV
jgi:hypothetical protein